MNRKHMWISALLGSFTMAIMMSGLISGYRLGFSGEWPAIWLDSFLLAWPAALTLNLTVLPQVRKLSNWLAGNDAVSQA